MDERTDIGSGSLAERLDQAMLTLDRWRGRPGVVVAGSVALLALVIVGWWMGRPSETRPVEELIPHVQLETTVPTTDPPVPVVVHVAGAVRSPGVYSLPADARVEDALDAAGGALAGADLDQLNLAAPLPDGVQIKVPLVGEVLAAAPSLSSPDSADGPIDINRASEGQLDDLPGIGPATAAAIVAWRDEHGPFSSTDGLLDVPGIGPAKLAALADLVVAG